jgi:hypothetical protein
MYHALTHADQMEARRERLSFRNGNPGAAVGEIANGAVEDVSAVVKRDPASEKTPSPAVRSALAVWRQIVRQVCRHAGIPKEHSSSQCRMSRSKINHYAL